MGWLRDEIRLQIFLAVAEEGSFSGASRRLGASQPSLSSHVAALESSVGQALFIRTARGVRLTAAGEALAAHAKEVLAAAERASQAVQAAARSEKRLRIGGGEVLVTYLLPPALAALKKALPGLEADLRIADGPEIIEALHQGLLDVAILADQPEGPLHTARRFGQDQLVCLCPEDHPFCIRNRIAPRELAQEVLVVRHAGAADRRKADAWLADLGVKPKALMVADTLEALKHCVAAGLGVGLVPRAAARQEGTKPISVVGAPVFDYYQVHPRGGNEEAFELLLGALREAARRPSRGERG